MQKELQSDLCKKAEVLLDKEIWGVIASVKTGYSFRLCIGNKIPLSAPLKGRFLSETVRNNKSEQFIVVENAAWRLNDIGRVICSSKSENSDDSKMIKGLNNLIGAKIQKLSLEFPGGDLLILLDNNLQLAIFSDCVDSIEDGDNYFVGFLDSLYTVGPKGLITISSR